MAGSCLLRAFIVLVLPWPDIPWAVAQEGTGFLSTSCGLPSGGNHIDPKTGFMWTSDDSLISGLGRCVLLPMQNSSIRIFPEGFKNCYTLNTSKGQEYLIRGSFEYGNYDQNFKPPVFNISIDATLVFQVSTAETSSKSYEVIVAAMSSSLAYCLISISNDGVPLISTLEVRPVHNNLYTQGNTSVILRKLTRIDTGNYNFLYRYPIDPFDRIWDMDTKTPGIVGLLPSNKSSGYLVPGVVLETAGVASILEILSGPEDGAALDYQIYLYFVELDDALVVGDRVFDIYANSAILQKDFDILKNSSFAKSQTLVFQVPFSEFLNLTLVASPSSRLPPSLNAVEIYQIVPTSMGTSSEEIEALGVIKHDFGLSRWSGDPCLPLSEDGRPNAWDGLSCSLSSGIPTVTGLDLSSRGLIGSIPSVINRLVNLEDLELQNNQLTGIIPEFLASLPHLRVLYLQNNNFSGNIPDSLLRKSDLHLLDLKYYGNSMLMSDNAIMSFPNEHRWVKVLVGCLVGVSILVLLLVVSVTLYCLYKCQEKLLASNANEEFTSPPKYVIKTVPEPEQVELKSIAVQQFSLVELVIATNSFSHRIGEGGFGAVYHGILPDGQAVAVKVRSASSIQGIREFTNELNLLSGIRHENLVPLLGYCSEQQILVYPYMSNGSLQDRLYGESARRKSLDWTTRLNIALGAARGLHFLHTAGVRCIIHRDVKTSNILLDNSMVAKVADFGFSKYAPQEDDSMVSLEVRGTAGYLDPEYYSTQQLTVKSDVFSFGVVLLEIICGREPLNIHRPRPEWSLVEWAKPFIQESNVQAIVDPAISSSYTPEAMWRVVEVALSSVESHGVYRPTMADIIRELEDALIIENNASQYMASIESIGSSVGDAKMPPPMPLFYHFDPSPVFSETMGSPDPR